MLHTINTNIMAQQITNIRNIELNDIITLTYNNGYKTTMKVTRVENKSWYYNDSCCRNSYGTLEGFFNNSGDIVKCEINKAK